MTGTVVGGRRYATALRAGPCCSALVGSSEVIWEIAEVARDIPFIGNYNQRLPASATIATAHRVLTLSGDPRPLTRHPPWRCRGTVQSARRWATGFQGRLVEKSGQMVRAAAEASTVSYAVERLRELSVMWAFGGAESWPRDRIDADFLARGRERGGHSTTLESAPVLPRSHTAGKRARQQAAVRKCVGGAGRLLRCPSWPYECGLAYSRGTL